MRAPDEAGSSDGDRRTGHGRLGELHRLGDHRLVDLVAERLDHPLQHLAAVGGAAVVHGGQDALELEVEVEPLAHLVDGVQQQGHAAQAEELALQRDEHAVRDGQRVDREQAQRRLAVDQDEVVLLADRAQHPGQRHLPGDLVDQLDLGGGEVDVGRQQVQPGHVGLDEDVLGRDVVLHEQVVDATGRGCAG